MLSVSLRSQISNDVIQSALFEAPYQLGLAQSDPKNEEKKLALNRADEQNLTTIAIITIINERLNFNVSRIVVI